MTQSQPPVQEQPRIDPLPHGMVEGLRIPGDEIDEPHRIQTHISHLFLTRDRVYKIRKAVHFPFLSFATRDERNRDCLLEVALNRRLSPGVYLGVAPIVRHDGEWRVGEASEGLSEAEKGDETPEHCVVMRRLPEDGDAQTLLEKGQLSAAHVDALADRIASFHLSHRLAPDDGESLRSWIEGIEGPFIQSLQMIQSNAPETSLAELVARLEPRVQDALKQRRELITARRQQGLAVDGHGDLQLAHAWFEEGQLDPSIIDCTEFNEGFRRIDPASEVAFLAMDLRYRGHPKLAERFLARYARETGDFGFYALVDCFTSYRAAVRAKVALLAALDREISDQQRAAAMKSARDHMNLVELHLQLPSPGAVIITCGIVGCGKSSAAGALAEALGAVVISSDRTRKQEAGVPPNDRTGADAEPGEGLYSEDRVRATYASLLEQAAPVVASGRRVILDASFSRADQRRTVLRWADGLGIEASLLHVACARDETLVRLARRERSDDDPSDAGPSLYQWSVERFEPPDEWPGARALRVDTDVAGWQGKLTREFARRDGAPQDPFQQPGGPPAEG